MIYLALGSILCVSVLAVTSVVFLNSMYRASQNVLVSMMNQERDRQQLEQTSWMRERELLMNRVMTKEWTSYAQMAGALQTSSPSDSDPPKGMSDEEELRRAGLDIQGLGDILLDEADEFKDALRAS